MKFIIKDWADNVCFHGREFNSFEDGWDFLYGMFPEGSNDGTFDDYFVMESN